MRIKLFKFLAFIFLLLSLTMTAVSFYIYDNYDNGFMLFNGFFVLFSYVFTFFYIKWRIKNERFDCLKKEAAKSYILISIINFIPGISIFLTILLCIKWIRKSIIIDYEF